MKRLALCLLLLSLVVCVHAQDNFTITGTLDHPDGLYKCGEEAVFSIVIKNNDVPVTTGEFNYVLTNDGVAKIASGKGQLGEEPTVIKGTLPEPGILRLSLTDAPYRVKPQYGNIIGAGFDVDKIQPTCVEPDDFASWWEEQKALVRALPADVQLQKVDDKSTPQQTTYAISFANINGTRQYGWLCVPTAEGKHPGILTVPAAGYAPYGPPAHFAAQGFLAMTLYAHNYPLDLPREKYDELAKTELNGYPFFGKESRDTYYFRRVFLGCTRFMDYLMSRPEWDGQTLIVTGSSQGGALSLICAGLEPKVTAIAANVPALCDHTGCLVDRACGWPRLIPDKNPDIAKVSAYFDAVNFARHAKCTTLISCGFVDGTCPATSVYSAYAVLPQPKRMFPTPWMGHAMDPAFGKLQQEFITSLGKLP
ncbi:MAG: acetylxylan esterase [Armatimonadetes bacterium]|nr:acetylxylan esterase [Armatimonadota bacterium]